MRLQDALFNWLQIKIVADARKEDGAATETMEFFESILREDHQLTEFAVANTDILNYTVTYVCSGERTTITFDRELTEKLLADINENPRYNETSR